MKVGTKQCEVGDKIMCTDKNSLKGCAHKRAVMASQNELHNSMVTDSVRLQLKIHALHLKL